jgi:PAS domain S-box-containing protein
MSQDKILIVDDEADIALILKLQLEDSGFATTRARDGIDALEKLAREAFDLVLLDIKMPRMDGLQVLARIQAERLNEVAVVMMTAHGNEDVAVKALKMGALDYVAKPFSTEDIVKKVEHAIRFNRTRLENRKLQQKLEEERQKGEAILQGMADLLIAVDERGAVMTVNRKAEEILEVSRDAIGGVAVAEVLKADIPAEQLPCLVALRTSAPCLDASYTIRRNDRSIQVLSSAAPLFSGGRLVGAVEIIRDMTRLRALEQDKEDFVSMLSHDLKTPITSIVGSLDLVREGRLGPVNQEQKLFLETAVESCDEMVDMIDTLLDVHKFEAGKMVLTFQPEDPQLLIQRVMTKFRSVARRTGLHLFSTIGGELPAINVDRSKFVRLLNNLLTNAVKFTPEGGEIELAAEPVEVVAGRIPAQLYPGLTLPERGEFLQISVRDTGIGIPSVALGTIFDRYVQAKSRRLSKTQGTGLGLAFCRKVMDAHHGYIWAESVEGTGSTFFLLFPLA